MNVSIKLKEEGGITAHSLFNAKALSLAHGEVRHVTLDGNARQCDYRTTVEYEDGFHWEYTGFAWGYGGEGPNGLVTFMAESTYSDRDSWRKLIFNMEPELKDYQLV